MVSMQTAAFAYLGLAFACTTVAQANISISNKPTQNMSCDAGVCTETAKKAVLNVGNLQAMLANGDATVKAGRLAKDIDIDQALTWSGNSRLTLDAQRSVIVNQQVTVTGKSALTVTTNDQGRIEAGGHSLSAIEPLSKEARLFQLVQHPDPSTRCRR